jgi:hypothetical protein
MTMLKSYEAIYDHGRIKWLGEAPKFKRARVVLVADDANELDEALVVEKPNGASQHYTCNTIRITDKHCREIW